MVAVSLPSSPAPRDINPRVVEAYNELRTAKGTNVQRVYRGGAHYAVDYTMPPMRSETARAWRRLFTQGEVIMRVPQPGLVTGTPGLALVATEAPSGSVLPLKGLTAHAYLQEGRLLSIETDGRHYLYAISANCVVASDGTVSVPLEIMLQTAHAEDDPVNLVDPVIQGFATVADDAHRAEVPGIVPGMQFTIEERA